MATLRISYDRQEHSLPSEIQGEPETVVFGPAKEMDYEGGIIVYRQCSRRCPGRGSAPYGLVIGMRAGERDEERGPDGQIHVAAFVVTIPKNQREKIARLFADMLRGPISFS